MYRYTMMYPVLVYNWMYWTTSSRHVIGKFYSMAKYMDKSRASHCNSLLISWPVGGTERSVVACVPWCWPMSQRLPASSVLCAGVWQGLVCRGLAASCLQGFRRWTSRVRHLPPWRSGTSQYYLKLGGTVKYLHHQWNNQNRIYVKN